VAYKEADYFTDDKKDAEDTAALMKAFEDNQRRKI